MGCNGSTLAPVCLCHERCKLVEEALRQSYLLGDAHLAHMHSLATLAPALHSFFLLHPHHRSHCSQTQTQTHYSPPPRFDDDLPFMPPSSSYPPSPTTWGWDFLNLFEALDHDRDTYQVRCSPSERNEQHSAANKDSSKVKSTSSDSEIQILMERASISGSPVLEMLHFAQLPYRQTVAVNPSFSSKMMHALTPLLSSNSPAVKSMHSSLTCHRMESLYSTVDRDGGVGMRCSLSSTLKKLSMWEKKLYDQVKVEEKLHVLYRKKCKQLNRMRSKKHVDEQKVEALKAVIQIISTKMKISIQVVDRISNTICKLGEEELRPLINEFILRFLGMWREMEECYRGQNEGIEEAESVEEACPLEKKQWVSKEHAEAAIRVKSELQKWNMSFSEWIHAQRCHVKALNGWLLRCLPEEEIHDGGSATKSSASSVWVICSKWSEAVDKMSEKKVIEAVNELIYGVKELLDKYITELQQRLEVDKELERRMRVVGREEEKMQKVVKAGSVGKQESEGGVSGSLHCRLKQIFCALENFTANSASAYELLCQHIQQE